MTEWMNEWMNEWTNEWVSEWVSEWAVNKRWMDGWMNERWMDRWINEWINKLNKWTSEREERMKSWVFMRYTKQLRTATATSTEQNKNYHRRRKTPVFKPWSNFFSFRKVEAERDWISAKKEANSATKEQTCLKTQGLKKNIFIAQVPHMCT